MPKKYPPYIKEKAIQLRVEKKMTVPDIAEHLKIRKSTIHTWLIDYPLEERTDKQKNAQKRNTKAMQAKFKKKREDAYAVGWEEAPELLKDPFMRDFVNMYMAEGFKRDRNTVSIANSDADVMLMAQHFVMKYANPNNKLTYDIQIHADHDEDEIREYWGNLMGVAPEEVRISRKSNSGKLSGRKQRSEYGVLSIRSSDTYFRSRLEAWLDYLQKLWLDKYSK